MTLARSMHRGRTALVALTLITAVGNAVWLPAAAHAETTATASAANSTKADNRSKVRRTPALRPQIYAKLEEAQKLADAKNYAGALGVLAALHKMPRNSYEQAMTWNLQAYVHFNKESYSDAIKAYEEVLKIPNIPLSLEENSQYSLARLYFVQEKYTQALSSLNAWFALTEKPNAQAHLMRAQIQYEMKKYQAALPDVKKAMQITREQGNKVPENWLLLERAIYFQNKDFTAMERCLQDLIALYPKKQYWLQLAAVYNEMNKPLKELAILEMMYEKGEFEAEQEWVNFAQALLGNNTPYKSAEVLLRGMKDKKVSESARTLTLLGDALMLAREYDEALKVMTRAAEASGAGKDYFKVAQLAADRQQWSKALDALDKSLKAGGLPNARDAHVLKGMVLFNMNKLAAARGEFQRAVQDPKTRATAEQWLRFIAAEEARLHYLAESGA